MSGAKVAVVTGAGSGVGAGIARALHRKGLRVLLTDVEMDPAEQVARELDPAGETAAAARLDVGHPEDFQQVLDQTVAKWDSVEVLVNNAAVTRARPLFDISTDEFNEVMAVNAGGTFSGSRIFGAHFKEQGFGRIVNMASLAGQNGGTATGVHYAASKGAILTLTKVFAKALGPFGVTVNAIAPGPMDTPMVRALVSDDDMEALVEGIPVRRIGDPVFVADLVAMLVSEEAAFVNGACWDVNGGLFMR